MSKKDTTPAEALSQDGATTEALGSPSAAASANPPVEQPPEAAAPRTEATLSEMATFIRGKVREFRGMVEAVIARTDRPAYHAAKDRLADTDKFLEKVVLQLQLGEQQDRAQAESQTSKVEG